MKKILFIAPLDTKRRFKGGITSYAKSIIDNSDVFKNNGINFVPMNNCLVNRKRGTNGKILFSNFINYFKTKKAISKKIKNENFDAIYLNTSYGLSLLKDLYTIKKKYKKNITVFLHIHFAGINEIFTKNKLIKYLINTNLKSRITNIISLSSFLKSELVNKGYKEDKISVLYNYYDPYLPMINENEIREKYNEPRNTVTFLFVGSFEKRKGFYDLINVFKEENFENTKLILCGKPNDLKAKTVINEISDNPIFNYVGYVSGNKKIDIFKQSNVLVLPSYSEGLPITILEALNFGLPIISTSVGAIPEIITDQEGILVHPGDKESLKKAIVYYINHNLLKISLNNLEKSKQFTFSVFANNLIAIINSKVKQ